MKKALIILGFLPALLFAQEEPKEEKKSEGSKAIISPIPIVAANPAFGFIYGAAVSGSKFLGDPKTTHLSNALMTATYSTKKQLMFTLKSTAYTANDEMMLMGDIRVFFSSQPTFGLGTGPQSSKLAYSDGLEYNDQLGQTIDQAQLMDFNLIRVYQTVMKKVANSTFFGFGYHLDAYFDIDDKLLDLDADPPVVTSHYAYSIEYGYDPEEYTISGLSVNTTHDTRDNINYPYSGKFAFLSYRYNPEFLGSTQDFSTLWAEYRQYFSLSAKNPKSVLAFWLYGNVVTTGNAPYMALPALGWDQMGKSGRAYPQGRFRGNGQIYGEVEARLPLPIKVKDKELFGFTAFCNATTITSKDNDIDIFEYVNPGYGLGLRVMLSEKARTNITLDYGWGSYGAGAFYLNLNEYF